MNTETKGRAAFLAHLEALEELLRRVTPEDDPVWPEARKRLDALRKAAESLPA